MTDTPPLQLFNSLTRQLETFQPVHPGEARVYTCGPTVYNYPHIGNMRAYAFADVLGRTLSWKGYKLTHIINITDVGHLTDDADAGEDKMEKMAAEKAQSIWDIAQHYTQAYWADVKALNIRQPAKWSIATDYIDEMIDFAKSIADKHCYELDSGLYFDVSTIEDYGRLARAVTEDGEGRIDTVDGKRNPQDFAIWRKTPAGEKRQMEWDSPWGKGAPGWHLECSVMGEKLLGFPFDIHTGGIDHREIHHPNEIAQNQAFCGCGGLSEATNSGAKIWMHNNFLVALQWEDMLSDHSYTGFERHADYNTSFWAYPRLRSFGLNHNTATKVLSSTQIPDIVYDKNLEWISNYHSDIINTNRLSVEAKLVDLSPNNMRAAFGHTGA